MAPHWLPKNEMTEEDIKLQFITPAIQQQWGPDHITMETNVQLTDGKIELKGNTPVRKKPKRADYVLYQSPYNPIAVVEAKDNKHTVSAGLQEAKGYAKMLDVPFAYSSNGDAFYEFDFLTGEERLIELDQFPSPDELKSRYRHEVNSGKGLTPAEESIMAQPYYSGQNTYPPRYYQRVAINRTVDAIARGQQRILLAMATGTGKTYTAFQIVYRLLKSGMKRKILYLADRNNLVDQSIEQDFAPLGKTIHKVDYSKDDPTTITSYEVYFALYQQLIGDGGAKHYEELFKPEFFDLVIVDECHRGSAAEDSQWRTILEYFKDATQIGMTATPKETKYVSNIDYFGEPLYSYSLREGIEDGFLAPFRVINLKTNIGDGWRPTLGQRDINGELIPDRIYNNLDYDYNIILQDRIDEVAAEITNYLKETDRMAKTIVFCANEDHAERMRCALAQCNADMMKVNPDYVVRITGSDDYGKNKLKEFISVRAEYPVIATTSELLTTGTDCKMTKLIVLDQRINSMTKFKQIIGRGTRIRENKLFFVVMDFRNVSRLFADPAWDGPIEQCDGYGKEPPPPKPESPPQKPQVPPDLPPDLPSYKPFVDANGCKVFIVQKTVSVYDANGKLLRQEDIIDYTKSSVLGEYSSLASFISAWDADMKKEAIRSLLLEHGINLEKIKAEMKMEEVDDFDFLCHVAYDQKALTRRERVDNVRKRDCLSKYGPDARKVLEALLNHYANYGVYEIAEMKVLQLDPINKLGTPPRIVGFFGGKDGYMSAVRELEHELYNYPAG